MNKNNSICAVLPVHKPAMTGYERVSLKACCTHLQNFDCFLVHPAGMDISEYLQVYPALIAKPVNPQWLSSVEDYNRMKVDAAFYEMFHTYNYMLTYELDAFIFSSDFEKYQVFEFDFIGAPIFEGYMNADKNSRFLGCLNSGFSVRNIQSCIKVLQEIPALKRQWKLFRFFKTNFTITRKILVKMKWKKLVVFEHDHWVAYIKGQYFHEDIFWSDITPVLFPFYKVADFKSASSFSFEVNAPHLFKLNNQTLPMGCHAWAKFMDFWKDHIDMKGY